MSNLKYSKDGLCVYDSTNHTYRVGTKKLTGVTSWISKYKNKFDAQAVAEAYVKKNGGDVDLLVAQWKLAGDLSCIAGTAVHNVFENYVLTGEILSTGLHEKETQAIKFINDFFETKRLIPVEAEVVIYDLDLGLASMIDCIAKNANEEYFILDWKTSKKITKDSYNKRMSRPFNYVPDSNFYHYSMQLSMYKKMYKEHKITKCYIVHLTNNSYTFLEAENIMV